MHLHGFQQVPCELPFDELVVRHVAVESSDDPVAVFMCMRSTTYAERMCLIFRVSGNVEPVATPLLPVVMGGEQAIDQLGICITQTNLLHGFQKFRNFVDGWR